MRLFVAETDDFFSRHLPQIVSKDFFDRIFSDREVVPDCHDDNAVGSDGLSLGQLVARELKLAVSELHKRSS